ncbi:MAG: hypothetical protein LBT40_14150 [Deltaproteobacteria bacterium]|jgi:hypothetical protein|nr:hypothetical protein [Deltaproteobacteria bacterium]
MSERTPDTLEGRHAPGELSTPITYTAFEMTLSLRVVELDAALKGAVTEIKGLVAEVKTEVINVKQELGEVKAELKGEIGEVKKDLGEVKKELNTLKEVINVTNTKLDLGLGNLSERVKHHSYLFGIFATIYAAALIALYGLLYPQNGTGNQPQKPPETSEAAIAHAAPARTAAPAWLPPESPSETSSPTEPVMPRPAPWSGETQDRSDRNL